MALPKGIVNVAIMRQRKLRGGQDKKADLWDRAQPDAMGLWRDAYLESLEARNYSPNTLASASIIPVIMPASPVGITILTMVFHFGIPNA